MDLKEILSQYLPDSQLYKISLYGNGHINDTYKVECNNTNQQYILQRINTNVFKKPQELITNHLKLQEYLASSQQDYQIPCLIKSIKDSYLYIDKEGGAWRLINFISKSYSIEIVETELQAFEAGKAYGWFANSCSGLNAFDFSEAIENFHKLSFRLGQLQDAINGNNANRLDSIKGIVDFYLNRKESLLEIEQLIENNEIPKRLVHNDTKINNLLFRDENAIAVIDLDTIGPGSIFYDYGDAIRTISNTASEDEKDLNLVGFNISTFKAFTKGYLLKTKSILSKKEKEYMHKAPILMTYIMGIRFLADYLNGDIYYKIKYSDHNLTRSLVQKRLIEHMELNIIQMKEAVSDCQD